MYKFGKNPPRSLRSFGVAGMLDDGCNIFYDSVFSGKHVGRISDLLSARLKESKLDEMRFRALVTFSFFESYRSQLSRDGKWPVSSQAVLSEPIVLECGIDHEKIAIGVSFNLPEGQELDIKALPERIKSGKTEKAVEEILVMLYQTCDRIIIKAQPSTRRYEVVTMMALPDQMPAPSQGKAEAFEVVVLENNVDDTPQAATYVEVGDLDYPELLKEDSPNAKFGSTPTGKILNDMTKVTGKDTGLEEDQSLLKAIQGRKKKEGEEVYQVEDVPQEEVDQAEQIVKGIDEAKEEETLVKGGAEDEEENTLVKGRPEEEDKTKQVVKGQAEEEDKTEQLVKGQKEEEDETQQTFGNTTEHIKDEKIVVKGGGEEEEESSELEVKSEATADKSAEQESDEAQTESAAEEEEEDDEETKQARVENEEILQALGQDKRKAALYQAQIKQLNAKIARLEERLKKQREIGGSGGAGAKGNKIGQILSSIWPFNRNSDEEDGDYEEDDDQEPGLDGESKPATPEEESAKAEADEDEELKNQTIDPSGAAKSILMMTEAGSFDHLVKKFTGELDSLKKELKSKRRKDWAVEFGEELTAEKKKLRTLAKKVNVGVRQRAMEFKNKERSIKDELKRREDNLKKKEKEISKLKDRVSQMNMNMERLKSSAQSSSLDAGFEKKYNHTKTLLAQNQSENEKLKKQLDEANKKLSNPANAGVSDNRLKMIQETLDRTKRQLDEFKKQNSLLMEKATSAEHKSAEKESTVKELKNRLDQAMRVAVKKKKVAEEATQKMEDLEKEKIVLATKMNALEASIERLKNENPEFAAALAGEIKAEEKAKDSGQEDAEKESA